MSYSLTISQLKEILSQYPDHYQVLFDPDGSEEIGYAIETVELEGDTQDGPGSILIKLI